MKAQLIPHIRFSEPALLFSPDDKAKSDIHPLRGLANFGPYTLGRVPGPLKIATISPISEKEEFFRFIAGMRDKIAAQRSDKFRPDWPGFEHIFGINIQGAPKRAHVFISEEDDRFILNSTNPSGDLAERLARAISQLTTVRTDFDVIFLLLPDRWKEAFYGLDEDDFDLHDYLKGVSAGFGSPLQIIRTDKALQYYDRNAVYWRLGVATYAKAGGVPWKLSATTGNVAYIGISYALRAEGIGKSKFVTCCSQVFDAEGAGLEFVAYDIDEVHFDGENPFLTEQQMSRVMLRSLELYNRRYPGNFPEKVIVHKNTEFKRAEVSGCLKALHMCREVELVQVISNVTWRGAKIEYQSGSNKGRAAAFPVDRGTVLDIGPQESLIWGHGSVEGIQKSGVFFQGQRGTPTPIKIVRYAGHGPLDDVVFSILGLSKMNWNNDNLYDKVPVTLGFSQTLARVVKRMPSLGSQPYAVRYFM